MNNTKEKEKKNAEREKQNSDKDERKGNTKTTSTCSFASPLLSLCISVFKQFNEKAKVDRVVLSRENKVKKKKEKRVTQFYCNS